MPHSGYTICTSEQRLTSTAVSHGFVIERYSSPPFGSHGPCIHSEPCPPDFGTGVPCSTLASRAWPGPLVSRKGLAHPRASQSHHSLGPQGAISTCHNPIHSRESSTRLPVQGIASLRPLKHHLGLLPSPCTAVFNLLTHKLHRLLGPCFKTGREWHCCTKLSARCTMHRLGD